MRYLLILLIFFPTVLPAQDDCDEDVSKSAKKAFEEACNTRKYGKVERMKRLKTLYKENEDYAALNFRLAIENIKTAKLNGGDPKAAEKYLLNVESLCPGYHSEVYFFLGEIYLGRKDYINAVKYYKKFLKYESEDESKFSKHYAKEYDTAEDNYNYAKFFADQFAHPVPFAPQKLHDVSTPKNGEYLPLVSPDDRYLFFTRRNLKTQEAGVSDGFIQSDKMETTERFSRAEKVGDLRFDRGRPLPSPFNTNERYNYGGATISPDNRHLYLTVCKMGKMNYINCDIFHTDYVKSMNEESGEIEWHWTKLKPLGKNVNGEYTWEAQPALSADGRTLYFASAREGAKGIDIYYSKQDSAGNWLPAKNLGPPINSGGNDKTPFIHADSHTMYFASDGHTGMGGFDVFYSRQNPDGTWVEPHNIGYPINTEKDEHGFVISSDGRTVYFSTAMFNGKNVQQLGLDIATFSLYREARPEKVAILTGHVISGEDTVKDAQIKVRNTITNEVQTFSADTTDGYYAAVVALKKDEDVVLDIESPSKELAFNARVIKYEDYVTDSESEEALKQNDVTAHVQHNVTDSAFNFPRDTAIPEQMQVKESTHIDPDIKRVDKINFQLDIPVHELKVNETVRLNSIYYKTNSADLSPESEVVLKELVHWMDRHPGVRIAILGHTDEVGSAESNLALSSDRAFSVMAWLQEHGIDKSRLSFKGYGETQPVADNSTAAGRILNRRTEFRIVKK